jgi:Fe-S-cluster containining protein
MEPRAFVEKYCRWVDLGQGLVLSLREKKNYDCIFWDNGCTVYAHRPVQCRTYPFWEGPLASAEKWKWEGRFCPGINRGKLHDKASIEEALARRRAHPVLRQGEV